MCSCNNRPGYEPPKYFQAQFHISSGPPLICEQSKHSLSISNLLFPNAAAGMQLPLSPGRSCQTRPCHSPTCWLFLFLLFYRCALQNVCSLAFSFFLLNSTCFSINWIYRQFIESYNDTLHAIDIPSVCLILLVQCQNTDFIKSKKIFFLL